MCGEDEHMNRTIRTLALAGTFIVFVVAHATPHAQRPASQGAAPVNGTGTPGTIPVWTNAGKTLTDSHVQDDGTTLALTEPVSGTVVVNGQLNSIAPAAGGTHALLGRTPNPSAAAVVGESTAVSGAGGAGLYGFAAATSGAAWGVLGEAHGIHGVAVQGSSPFKAIVGINEDCNASGCMPVAGTAAGAFTTGAGGTLLRGFQSDPQNNWTLTFRVDSSGQVFANGGVQTSGADFAESMTVSGQRSRYEPGDVVVIQRDASRRVALSAEPYSTLVAGIYSTKPGVLAAPYSIEESHTATDIPLAVVGVVPCKVTASNGSILAGDLLVTSETPGYAMKGTDRGRMLGAVVGKALEPLASGVGLIQVLVTLQ
jgi:hypothetical protein